MSRIPPNLLYLAIYNPTLRPIGPFVEDEEDAEEQAHILFYTSKERAVSRDRMLRQVGLAKALVNFSDMLNNGSDTCNNVHSLSKRMIMVSPEPDFWIHAAIEVAKVPRSPLEKGKGKVSDRTRHAEKGKEKEKPDTAPLFDYQDGSVHDLALRADIIRGYERFKLTHGSFTSILSKLGREALSLQLERFFTVWAWSWNLEDGSEFADHLGMPLYPTFRALTPVLDDFSERHRKASLFIQPPYVVPSSQYLASSYPTSLIQHLLALIPPLSSASDGHPPEGASEGRRSSGDTSTSKDGPKGTLETPNSTFLGIPTANMDMRKWNWPGYLTFGKGSGKRPGLEESGTSAPPPEKAPDAVSELPLSPRVAGLDKTALEDAILDNIPAAVTNASINGGRSTPSSPVEVNGTEEMTISISHVRNPADIEANTIAQATPTLETSPTQPVEKRLQQPSSISVYLAASGNPLHTTRQKIFYILHGNKMLALVGFEEDPSTSAPELVHSMSIAWGDIDVILAEELSKTITPDQLSAQRILQPTDTHIISSGAYTISSSNFSSQSSHLYDAQELQTTDPDILEVFSRGLNPQHWHVARRGIDTEIQSSKEQGEVYMQIFRKEASLSDVDNVLAGVTRLHT